MGQRTNSMEVLLARHAALTRKSKHCFHQTTLSHPLPRRMVPDAMKPYLLFLARDRFRLCLRHRLRDDAQIHLYIALDQILGTVSPSIETFCVSR